TPPVPTTTATTFPSPSSTVSEDTLMFDDRLNPAFNFSAGLGGLTLTLALLSFHPGALAQLSSEEIARLGFSGTELTPMGAIRAGNAEGTIPEWKYEPLPVPPGFSPGQHHPDPFADDQILFTITAENYRDHADKLTPGQLKLFEMIPGYKMHIYPSRRSAVYEKRFYDAAMANARTAEIVVSGNQVGFGNAVIAWPFPIPKDGQEAIVNAMTRPL